MTDIFLALGDFLEKAINILPALGNGPNYLIILAMFGFLVFWILQLKKFNKEEEF